MKHGPTFNARNSPQRVVHVQSTGMCNTWRGRNGRLSSAVCRVVATCVNGDVAYVLLDTGSDGRPYLYGVNCQRHYGLWSERGSSNGPGWSQAGSDPHLGTLVDWGEAPPEADAVRLDFNGAVLEAAVNDGVYLAAWWRTPCPRVAWPRVEALRVMGEWVRPSQRGTP